MVDLLVAAIPGFLLLMIVEVISYRQLAHHHSESTQELDHYGYEVKDTRTSLSMGIGNLVISAGWNIVALAAYTGLYVISPFRIDMGDWWNWIILAILFDLLFYVDHRAHHRIRIAWASHVVHHSSQHFNLSTALRQPWTPMTGTIFFVPLPLMGFPAGDVALMAAINLLTQFWIHTERINKMPRWFEFIFNTPSHHRVHHGSDEKYLDCNYGGTLIIWDRMFGSFVLEEERPNYGLTTNLETYNPAKVAFHEFGAIANDVKSTRSWRARLGYVFKPPGWEPR